MWTLLNNGIEKTAAAWGIDGESIQLSYGSQITDTLELTFTKLAFDVDIPFEFDSLVTLKRNSVAVFQGRVMTTPRAGSPESESISLTIHGPWQELEDTVFEQYWKTNAGEEMKRISRVIMGQALDGTRQNAALCVEEIFNYAALCGLNIQLGSNMGALLIPFSEVREQSLASLLRRYLSWQPNVATWVDYSTTPPTLNIVSRPDAAEMTLAIGGAPVSGVRLTPRHDLVVPGVIIRYLVNAVIEGNAVSDIQTDAFPLDADPLNRRVLKASFDLNGGSVSTATQEQYLKTRALPTDWSDVEWWKKKLEWMTDPNVSDIVVDGVGKEFSYSWGNEQNSFFYLREIEAGTWQDWMSKEVTPAIHVVTGKVRTTCTFKYTIDGAEQIRRCQIEAGVTSTNAATGTYKKKTSTVSPGEVPPVGLAEQYYAAVSELQYDGSFVLIEREALGTPIRPGMVVNLTGGRAEWATMRAQIQQVAVTLGNGTTTITVGPSKHLGLDTLMQLNQPARIQVAPTNDQSRASGKSKKADATMSGASAVPNDSGAMGAGVPKQTQWADKDDNTKEVTIGVKSVPEIFLNKTGGSIKQIRISTNDIPSGCTSGIYIREIDVCEDGEPKKIAVLCSASYSAGGGGGA